MTRRNGVEGGRPRRFACGFLVRQAQSSGECPGVKRTFLRGLEGMELCVGGVAREVGGAMGLRLGSGPGGGGGIKDAVAFVVRGFTLNWKLGSRGGPVLPPDARCAEFAAGKEGINGSSLPSSRVKGGISADFAAGLLAIALGASCGEVVLGDGMDGFAKEGGGMALRSMSSRDAAACLGLSTIVFAAGETCALRLGWR